VVFLGFIGRVFLGGFVIANPVRTGITYQSVSVGGMKGLVHFSHWFYQIPIDIHRPTLVPVLS
jgi:hypothetical protein